MKISDVNGIKALGLNPPDVADTVMSLFTEMIYHHGFVHCDPHPGNLLVRRRPVNENDAPRRGGDQFANTTSEAQVVLLDHGLYRELSEQFRLNYCSLWVAMVTQNEPMLNEVTAKMGIGKYAGMYVLRACTGHDTR